jgi:yersiniabactin salicyl-AMP ligase
MDRRYIEKTLDSDVPVLSLVESLIEAGVFKEIFYIYERPGEYSVGIGVAARVISDGEKAWLQEKEQEALYSLDSVYKSINAALSKVPIEKWRAYGTVDFEFSHIVNNINNKHIEKKKDVVHLVVPESELRITSNTITVRSLEKSEHTSLIEKVMTVIESTRTNCTEVDLLLQKRAVKKLQPKINSSERTEYKKMVQDAVMEISSGQYTKVILSRHIPLDSDYDLLTTFISGRKENNPARSFVIHRHGQKVVGFSPETIVEVSATGLVSTQPLAGTRSMGIDNNERNRLKTELLSDSKEVAEHAMSVKLSCEELSQVCDASSVKIDDFMYVAQRGSVQHIASRVTGQLSKNQTPWDAFGALFPAVTASGIPKVEAVEAVARLEPRARGLYSGAMLTVDSSGELDAALILRAVFSNKGYGWIQAGAGIIKESRPDREFDETCEKLGSIHPYIYAKKS